MPKKIIDILEIQVNDSVEIIAEKNRIIIQKPKKYGLSNLFAGYKDGQPEEFWDKPQGREEL